MMLAFLVPSGLQRTAVSSEEVPKINAKTSLLGMHKSTVQHVFVDRRHRPRSHSLPLHQTKHVRFKNLTRTKKSWEVFQPPKPWWSFHRFPMDFQWVSHGFPLGSPAIHSMAPCTQKAMAVEVDITKSVVACMGRCLAPKGWRIWYKWRIWM